MLKTVLLASAMMISVPALAQDKAASGKPMKDTPAAESTTAKPAQDATTAPTQATPATPPADTASAQPAQDATVADQTQSATATPPASDPAAAPAQAAQAAPAPAADPAAAAPAQAAQAEPAASGGSQVAGVVNTEFPSYDKNSDGNLDKTEFGSWMVALKSASDPSTKANDPATKKWSDGAFASADTDKSGSVSKGELTTYLSGAAKSGD